MSDWPQNIASNTPSKYLFKLVSETDFCDCKPEPLEWKSGAIEMKRDLESGGVMISFLCDSLTFVGNGASFLKNLYNNKEVNAKCTLKIYWWKWSTRAYVEFPSQFDINFCFYETVKVGRFFYGVRVKAINSSTQTKLDNRKDVDVDITKLISIGGIAIRDYQGLKKNLHFDATNVNYKAVLVSTAMGYELYHKSEVYSYTSVPLTINELSEFTEVRNVPYLSQIVSLTDIPSVFKTAAFDYLDANSSGLEINYTILGRVYNKHSGTAPWTILILETKESSGMTEIVNSYELGTFGNNIEDIEFSGLVTVDCHKGNDLKFVIGVASIGDTGARLNLGQMIITQRVASSLDTTTEGYPIYEALERVCQLDLDVQYPIYSDFFGRVDTPYKDGVFYGSENQLRHAHIQTGLNQRGVPIDDIRYPIALNFKNIFQTLKCIWNVGYSLEINSTLFGDSNPRIRIEEYSHFFQNTELIFDPPLLNRINKYDIQSQVMPELIPLDIKAGFNNYEYLSINGRAEPNTTSQRTSAMNTATKLENIVPYRADTRQILLNLSDPVVLAAGSTDNRGDSDIFIVKTQRLSTWWDAEKATNITVTEGTSLFKNDLLNRYFTPARMMKRYGNRIKSGMMKLPADSVLRFQKSDKSNELETTGEGYTIIENDDILVSSLDAPIYKAMKHTAIIPEWTFTDQELIQLYPFKYISFGIGLDGVEISGYLLNFKKKNAEDKCELTLIERYVP